MPKPGTCPLGVVAELGGKRRLECGRKREEKDGCMKAVLVECQIDESVQWCKQSVLVVQGEDGRTELWSESDVGTGELRWAVDRDPETVEGQMGFCQTVVFAGGRQERALNCNGLAALAVWFLLSMCFFACSWC